MDEGFNLPDTRYTFRTLDDKIIKVQIIRHFYEDDNEEINFNVSFDIICNDDFTTSLPIGIKESTAIDISHKLYPNEDTKYTQDENELDAIYAAERRAGC